MEKPLFRITPYLTALDTVKAACPKESCKQKFAGLSQSKKARRFEDAVSFLLKFFDTVSLLYRPAPIDGNDCTCQI